MDTVLLSLVGIIVVALLLVCASRFIRWAMASYLKFHRLKFWSTISMIFGAGCLSLSVVIMFFIINYPLMLITDEIASRTHNYFFWDTAYYGLAFCLFFFSIAIVAWMYNYIPRGRKHMQWLANITAASSSEELQQKVQQEMQ